MEKLEKTALVTGASRGIGRAIALTLGQAGYAVAVNYAGSEAAAEAVKNEIIAAGGKAFTLQGDVSDPEDVEHMFEKIKEGFGFLDVLVNNAGLAVGLDPIYKGEVDDWERMIDTNVKGLLYVTRVVTPVMVERCSGHIINIGSIAGKAVYPNGAVYCATKYAVNALHQGMRMDLLPYNIRVTQICPGAVETEFSLVRFKGDKGRADQVYTGYENLVVDDIAESVYFAISQPPHVDIQDMLVMPTAQATGNMFHKKEK